MGEQKQEVMKNLPEKIFLQIGDNCPDDVDFSELTDVTHSVERIFKNDIEYIRKDVAEKMAKEFASFMVGGEYTLWEDGTWLGHRDDNTHFEVNIDELFTEFINSRKA